MSLKILSRRTPLIIISLGLLFFLALIFYFIPISYAQNASGALIKNTLTLPKQKQSNPGLPKRLKVPQINIDIALESVGLTSRGAVDVPRGRANAAWFNLGPRPGEVGNAVIDGHYGIWKNGQTAVFNNLSKLKKGDKLYIIDAQGATTTFVVREFKTYDWTSSVPKIFFSDDEKSHLNLITCGGTWNKTSQNYSKRLVVFTDKE